MFKKVILMVLALCLMFSICVTAENVNSNASDDAMVQEMPRQRGEFDGSNMPQGGFDPSRMPSDAPTFEGDNQMGENSSSQENGMQTKGAPPQFGGQMPGGMGGFSGNMQNANVEERTEQETGFMAFVKEYQTPVTAMVLLILAYVFVIFYKRKHY